jgi:Tfp pilus assembly protein PilP
MNGIPKKRLLLYGLLLVALAALNLFRLESQGTETVEAVKTDTRATTVPELVLDAADPTRRAGTRDIFRAAPEPPPPPVAVTPSEPETEPVPPDPRQIALDAARRQVEAYKLIGVVASGDGALAVLDHDGNTQTRGLGEEMAPGFVLDRISQGEIRVRNERLGVIAVMTLGGADPLQMIRID